MAPTRHYKPIYEVKVGPLTAVQTEFEILLWQKVYFRGKIYVVDQVEFQLLTPNFGNAIFHLANLKFPWNSSA